MQTILRDREGGGWRIDRHDVGNCMQGIDWHIFEFVGNDIAIGRELCERIGVVKGFLDYSTCTSSRRRIRWVNEAAFEAQILRGGAQHLAELAGPNNANSHCCAYQSRGSESANTRFV